MGARLALRSKHQQDSRRMGAALLPQHEIQLGKSAASELGHQLNEARQMRRSAFHVRREKAAFSSGCKAHPATAPAGSDRSRHGGDEVSEAFG